MNMISGSKKLFIFTFESVIFVLFILANYATVCSAGTFTPTGSMDAGRDSHTATLLLDGKVLIAGGWNDTGALATAELYDPLTGSFTTPKSMGTRFSHTATLLPDGKVLIAGGCINNCTGYIATAEIYDPVPESFTQTGVMRAVRAKHTATLLPNGKVLIAGGCHSVGALASAELYNPSTWYFISTVWMGTARQSHTATLLLNGKVLIAGGHNSAGYLNSAELYDSSPSVSSFTSTGRLVDTTIIMSKLLLINALTDPFKIEICWRCIIAAMATNSNNTDISITFDTVTTSGDTTVTASDIGPQLPSGFKHGLLPLYFDISTTAVYTGTINVSINYDPTLYSSERSLRLLHYNGSRWDDITTGLDITAHIISGVTLSLSPFVIVQQSSTAVTLLNFNARPDADKVALTWATASETDNEGFSVLRGESASGPFTAISSKIPAMGGVGMKATYSFTDNNTEAGKTYYYQLQNIDSKGLVTAHNVVPVTIAVAGGDGISKDAKDKIASGTSSPRNDGSEGNARNNMAGSGARTDSGQANRATASISAVLKEEAVHPSMEREIKGSEGLSQQNSINAGDAVVEIAPVTSKETTRNDREMAHSSSAGIQQYKNGASSLSINIEDKMGNILSISKVEGVSSYDKESSALKATEESGRMVLTWHSLSPNKGFILYRSEKGKDSYTVISDKIPYLGIDRAEHYLYRFIDNSAKPGINYDYRLEVVTPEQAERIARH